MTLVEENLLGLALKPLLMLWFAFVCFSSETDVFQPLFPLEVLPPSLPLPSLQCFQFWCFPAGAAALRSSVAEPCINSLV